MALQDRTEAVIGAMIRSAPCALSRKGKGKGTDQLRYGGSLAS